MDGAGCRRPVGTEQGDLIDLIFNTIATNTNDNMVGIRKLLKTMILQLLDGMSGFRRPLTSPFRSSQRILAIVSIIFLPCTFLTGFYGMNFDPDMFPELYLPGGTRTSWVVMLVITVATLTVFGVMGMLDCECCAQTEEGAQTIGLGGAILKASRVLGVFLLDQKHCP